MEQISPYYEYYARALVRANSKSHIKLEEAIECLKEALKYKKTEEAYRLLVNCCYKISDFESSEKALLEAVEAGFKGLYPMCGNFYAAPTDRCSKEESLKYFKLGMDNKDPNAFYDLAIIYIRGSRAFTPDHEKAMEILKEGLALNDYRFYGSLAFELANLYKEKEDWENARVFYEKAIEFGNKESYIHLAAMYKYGYGVEVDTNKYAEYLLKNINKDSGYFIGELFSDNECTPQNYDLATYFLRYSANSGNGDACFLLATFLAMQGNYNEKEVDTYFENAFKFGLNKLWFNGAYLKFVSYVDQRTQNKIKELESRYWNLVRDQA